MSREFHDFMPKESFEKISVFTKGLGNLLKMGEETIISSIRDNSLPSYLGQSHMALCIKEEEQDFHTFHELCDGCSMRFLEDSRCRDFFYDEVRKEYQEIRNGKEDVSDFLRNIGIMKAHFDDLIQNWVSKRRFYNKIRNARHYLGPHGTYVVLDEL